MPTKMVHLVYFLEYMNSLNSLDYNQKSQIQTTFIKLKEKSMILIAQIVKNLNLLNPGIVYRDLSYLKTPLILKHLLKMKAFG